MEWIRNIRLRQLEILARLCELGNLSRVAEEFHLTQPALSKWLREFEEQLGVPLFQRHARGVSPLPAAFELVRHTHAIAHRLKRAQTALDQMKAFVTSQLTIGVSPMVAIVFLPAIIQKFRARFPNTLLKIEESTLDVLIPKLRADEIDVAIGRVDFDGALPDLNLEWFEGVAPCLAVCASHPLAARPFVEWHETLEYPWIAPPATSPVRQQMQVAFEKVGLGALPIMIESTSVASTARVITGTHLIAPLSHSLATALGLTTTLNVAWPVLNTKVATGLLWRHDDTEFELLQQFLECVRSEVSVVGSQWSA